MDRVKIVRRVVFIACIADGAICGHVRDFVAIRCLIAANGAVVGRKEKRSYDVVNETSLPNVSPPAADHAAARP